MTERGRARLGGAEHGCLAVCRATSRRLRSGTWRWVLGALAAVLVTSACAGFAEPALQPLTREPLSRVVIPPVQGKTASFDIMATDQESHRLYVADSLDQGVDVIDTSTPAGHYLRTIALPAAPAGIAFASDLHRLFTGNGDSTVSVIDVDPTSPRLYNVLANISTNGASPADLMDYDSKDHKLYVTNPDEGFLSAIDVTKNIVAKQIPNLGLLEQPRYDPADGMLYVVVADDNSVIQIDARRDVVVRKTQLPVICLPHGLAINPAINQGLIGCGDKDNLLTLVWDFSAQRMVRSFDLAGGGDAVIFDAKAQHFYFAAEGFAPPELAVFNAAPITFLTAVPTSHRSHTVAYDEVHRLIYTYDGKSREAALWSFPDPVAGCYGTEAQLASDGAPREQTPNCHPDAPPAAGP